ncbi:hypothetical protein [Planobispora takensis]|uniref:Uncharacterized protein n=1 Tax=Planobispora takensis TaxID=1367882 RepID=A0A8J3T0T3_9ACTN|nr:hypothetical protein [Planobispora takensis]GII03992.1 hypothetical protein Pta02_60000 [Planobispora takensis]
MARVWTAVAAAGIFLTAACGADPTAPGPASPPGRTPPSSAAPGVTAPGTTPSPASAPSGATAAPRPTGRIETAPEWKTVPDPPLKPSHSLVDVAASGPSEVWAVGYQYGAEDREGMPAVVRWDGSRWREMKVGADEVYHMEGVSVGGPDDVWIAGNGESAFTAHWDGRRWTPHRPFGVAQDHRLSDVAASGGRAWFVSNSPGGASVVEWTGDRFRNVFQSPSTIEAITVGDGRVWAVGHSGAQGPVIIEGTGQSWGSQGFPEIPGGRLNQVWQVSPSDVWAVGEVSTGPEDIYGHRPAEPLVMHWNGSEWARVQIPVARGSLHGVTASGGDVWVGGVDADHPGRPLMLRFDGAQWTARYGPLLRTPGPEQQYEVSDDVRRTVVTAVPGSRTVWAVGAVGWGDTEAGFALRH